MDIENALRDKLAQEWDVDFSDGGGTPWSNIHDFGDGYMSMSAVQLTEGDFGTDIRVYRAFPTGGTVQVSVDLEMSAKKFADPNRESFAYDNGERGDFAEWRNAISSEVGGDVVIVWGNDEAPFFSFVARTVKIGTAERVICGQCENTPSGVTVQVDLDRPLQEFVSTAPKPAQPAFA